MINNLVNEHLIVNVLANDKALNFDSTYGFKLIVFCNKLL